MFYSLLPSSNNVSCRNKPVPAFKASVAVRHFSHRPVFIPKVSRCTAEYVGETATQQLLFPSTGLTCFEHGRRPSTNSISANLLIARRQHRRTHAPRTRCAHAKRRCASSNRWPLTSLRPGHAQTRARSQVGINTYDSERFGQRSHKCVLIYAEPHAAFRTRLFEPLRLIPSKKLRTSRGNPGKNVIENGVCELRAK